MKKIDFEFIRNQALFRDLDDDKVNTIIGDAIPTEYPRGKVLFHQGDPADHFYIILTGWVKIFRISADGHEAVIGVFSEGETVADAAIFLGRRFPASGEVVEDATILRISGVRLRNCIYEDPSIALSMLASMSLHMKSLIDQVAQMKLYHGPQRVASFLLRLCPIPSGPAVVSLPYEKTLIASRLGMQPESLSRALNKLRNLGVTVNHGHVVVNDVAELARFAHEDPPKKRVHEEKTAQ